MSWMARRKRRFSGCNELNMPAATCRLRHRPETDGAQVDLNINAGRLYHFLPACPSRPKPVHPCTRLPRVRTNNGQLHGLIATCMPVAAICLAYRPQTGSRYRWPWSTGMFTHSPLLCRIFSLSDQASLQFTRRPYPSNTFHCSICVNP